MKREKVIILGPSGSGKNFLMESLTSFNLKPCVKTTTRPNRTNEVDGVDYHFVSKEQFFNQLENNEMLVYQSFIVNPSNLDIDTWYYGITNIEFEISDIVILTPNEYSDILLRYNKDDLFVVYLDIERSVRKERINLRNDKNDSIERRLDADDIDFKQFKEYDLRVTDPDFTSDDIYSLIA